MFKDYITLLLANMTAGFFLLAYFLHRRPEGEEQRGWAPGFAAVGFVATVAGLDMTLTWPIPSMQGTNLQFANIAFGELSVLFGVLFLAGALALACHWPLHSLALYAFFAGLTAVWVGVRIWSLGLTNTPVLAGIGFILSGLSGLLICPALYLRDNKAARTLFAALLAIAGLIWGYIGAKGYWSHLARYSTPPQARQADSS